MLRGSIEIAHRNRVSGWIYSSSAPVRDKLILAFVGERCVGAGKVDRFREDLLEAKLGDGYCGYDFPIHLNDGENLGAVVIRLQNSDAALIQTNTRMFGPGDRVGGRISDLGAIAPDSVKWMQDRGWLDQPEYDFLKAAQNIGAYERGLRLPRRAGAEEHPLRKPEAVVAELIALYTLGDVDVSQIPVKVLSDLGDAAFMRENAISLFALWSPEPSRVCVDERSHLDPSAKHGCLATPPLGGIEYSFGPDRVLFLHRDTGFAPLGPAPVSGATVLTAAPRGTTASAVAEAPRRVRAA
jgi:hypothetical protein